MDRTRLLLQHAPELLWEKPEERFRVSMEHVRNAISGATSTAYVPATTPSANSPGGLIAPTGASMASSEEGEEEDGAGCAPSEAGTDVVMSECSDTACSSLLSTPSLALERDYQHQQQQQGMVHASPLAVSVWRKGSGGQQDLLLGRATVPPSYIDRPPGDVWLPLADVGNSRSTTAASTSSGGVNQKGAPGPNAGCEGADVPALGTVLEHPHPGAFTGDADPTGGKRGGTKPWGGGLFRRKRPKKGGEATKAGQHGAATAGSVRVWLGKARRGSPSGQQPGKGHAILRVHGASALRKVRLDRRPRHKKNSQKPAPQYYYYYYYRRLPEAREKMLLRIVWCRFQRRYLLSVTLTRPTVTGVPIRSASSRGMVKLPGRHLPCTTRWTHAGTVKRRRFSLGFPWTAACANCTSTCGTWTSPAPDKGE